MNDLARPSDPLPPRKVAKAVTLPETTEAMPWPSNHEVKKESNPFTDRDWRMLGYAWLGLLVRLVLILGAIFSVYQFLAAREERRVEQSLALVDLWEQTGYQDAQQALKQRLSDLNARYSSLLGSQPTPAERAVYYNRIGLEALAADGGTMPLADFQGHFDRIVYFLNRLSFCVERNLCARDVADAYFRDFAVSFWSYFSGYVERQRKAGSPAFAVAIERYVQADQPAAEAR